MNIVINQDHPHQAYEVQGYAGLNDWNDIIAWLNRTDLPEVLSFVFEGDQYRFQTRKERTLFALGLDKARDLLDDEPKLGTRMDDDGRAFYVLTNADSKEGLEDLKTILLQALFLSKWPDHLDDFHVYVSSTCLLLISKECWDSLSLPQKRSLVDRCHGYSDALDAATR